MSPPATGGGHVVVIGLGNIGSSLIDLLGRMDVVTAVTLIDGDIYEARNLVSQKILRHDLGKSKARVQARRLRRLNPSLAVTSFCETIQEVPLGRLRGALWIACLDSLAARLAVNEAAWRLGMPWVDGGVDPEASLARMNVYLPGPEQPCMECALDNYSGLENRYACAAAPAPAAPTRGTLELGCFTASLLAVECRKILAGKLEQSLAGAQVIVDLAHHAHYRTRFQRNAACRFDHRSWAIQPLPGIAVYDSLRATFDAARNVLGTSSALRLRIPGIPFATGFQCPACSHRVARLRLQQRLPETLKFCPRCDHGQRLSPTGHFETGRGLSEDLPASELDRPLQTFGIRSGDVLVLESGNGETCFEIPETGRDSP